MKIKLPKKTSCMYICQHCLVHLGDIGKHVTSILCLCALSMLAAWKTSCIYCCENLYASVHRWKVIQQLVCLSVHLFCDNLHATTEGQFRNIFDIWKLLWQCYENAKQRSQSCEAIILGDNFHATSVCVCDSTVQTTEWSGTGLLPTCSQTCSLQRSVSLHASVVTLPSMLLFTSLCSGSFAAESRSLA